MSDGPLTPRQAQVADMVARGLSNKDIAKRLGVKTETVNDHVSGAAGRLPGAAKPRHKLTVWILNLLHDDEGV